MTALIRPEALVSKVLPLSCLLHSCIQAVSENGLMFAQLCLAFNDALKVGLTPVLIRNMLKPSFPTQNLLLSVPLFDLRVVVETFIVA